MGILDYTAPRVEVIEVKTQRVLCQSKRSKGSMREYDFVDGGFGMDYQFEK